MNLPYDQQVLRGRVAVVAGATRVQVVALPLRSVKQARLLPVPAAPAVFDGLSLITIVLRRSRRLQS